MTFEPEATVKRAIAGDPDALGALWREHREWLAAVVVARIPREAQLEDLLQEVALAVVRNIHALQDPAAVKPWLYRIAVNVTQTAMRRAYAVRGNGSLSKISKIASPEGRLGRGSADGREAIRHTVDLVHALPEKYREPLLLRAVRGLSQQQIADVLDIPVKTVETRLLRARQLLSKRASQRSPRHRIEEGTHDDKQTGHPDQSRSGA